MNRVPCKKCPQCGLFNDFTVEECECGKKLNSVGAQLICTDELSPEVYGEIDPSRKVYVQKCSACGALNYTDDPSRPVRVCYNCHKTRIAAIAPVEYVDTADDGQEAPAASAAEAASGHTGSASPAERRPIQQTIPTAAPEDDDDEDDDDNDDNASPWQGILGNLHKTAGPSPAAPQGVKSTVAIPVPAAADDKDDDDDDDQAGNWSGILGNQSKPSAAAAPAAAPTAKKDITLTAIRYGRLSFTVEAGPNPYMLGRSANQSRFLDQDGRVGNEHCYLFYRNGSWFVKDNHSGNGTAVNSRDLGLDGECRLTDGDELKLGHHSDSVAFRVSFDKC